MLVVEVLTWLAVALWALGTITVCTWRPSPPLWPSLFFVALLALMWSVGAVMTSFIVTTPEASWTWTVVRYSAIIFLPPTWWLFAVNFAASLGRPLRWAGYALRYGPFVLGAVFWLLLVTSPWHRLFIVTHVAGRNEYLVGWYLNAAHAYTLLFGNLLVLGWLYMTSREPAVRRQLSIMLVASAAPIVCNLLYTTRLVDPGFDLTPSGLTVTACLFVLGAYRERLFALSRLTLQHLIQREQDGLIVADVNGRLLHANAAAIQLLDMAAPSPGLDVYALLARQLRRPSDIVRPIEPGQLREELTRAPQTGLEREYRLKSSSPQWVRLSTIPIPNRRGKAQGVGLRLRDITVVREAEETARERERLLAATLESTADGILVVSAERRITHFNKRMAAMWRIPEELLATKDDRDFLRYAASCIVDPEQFVAKVSALYESSNTDFDTLTFRDGRVYERYSCPLIRDGKAAGRVWSFRDVTEWKREEERRLVLERRILHARKMESLGALAGGIAHDFNNILTAILTNADLAIQGLAPTSPLRTNLEAIERGARRAAQLSEQMLAYAGRAELAVRLVDLSETAKAIDPLLKTALSEKVSLGLELRLDLDPVEADPAQIQQILLNLVTNASEAIGSNKGTIRIKTGMQECDESYLAQSYLDEKRPPGKYVYLEVSDTGPGMDPETMQRAFEPFFTTKAMGRGLGLAAVLGIVRAHKGAIVVQSSPGNGSVYRVLFPVAASRTNGGRG